jgi:hypothetical protein
MLVCKPRGRGNWGTLVLAINGRRAPLPLEVHVGQLLTIAGREYRICKVLP